MYLLTIMELEFSKKKSSDVFKATQKKIEDAADRMEEIAESHTSIFNNSNFTDNDEYVELVEYIDKLRSELFNKEKRDARIIYDTDTQITYVEDVTGGIVIDGDTRLAGSFPKFLEKLEENYLVVNIIDKD